MSDLYNVKVYSSNQLVGVTDKKGEVIVPNLVSYLDNHLSIEDNDIPVNYDIPEIVKYVSTPYRGGGAVRFDTSNVQEGSTVYLFFIEKFFQQKCGEPSTAPSALPVG